MSAVSSMAWPRSSSFRTFVRTAEWYRDKFGFEILGYFFGAARLCHRPPRTVEIHFGKGDSDEIKNERERSQRAWNDAYVFVKDMRLFTTS